MNFTNIRTLYREIEQYEQKEITVGGWLRSKRDSKTFGFLVIHDGTFFEPLQVVYSDALDNFQEIARLQVGAAVIVRGIVTMTPDAKQPFELQALQIEIEGKSASDYPLQKKRHSMEYLRTISHLRPRTNTFQAVFRIRSLLAAAIHNFFQERDFVYVHTPIITGSDCEGAGEMFQVTTLDLAKLPVTESGVIDYSGDFFGKPTNLTVSGQLNGETYAMAFKNIYTFGPTFRAEKSNTTRHAAEFWMIEPEMAFADIYDDMDLAEDMVRTCVKHVMDKCPDDLALFDKFVEPGLIAKLQNIVDNGFARITYAEAIDIMKKSGHKFEYEPEFGIDMQTEHERYLAETHFKRPVIVRDYPKEIKAFYMRLNDDGRTVAAMDVLVPGIGEMIGGSQRGERYDVLVQKIKEMGMKVEDYAWYLDSRKYGSVPHAGFGLGFERMMMLVTGIGNIRDVIPFPRTPNSINF